MSRLALAAAIAASLAACGPGNSEVTIAGHSLKPKAGDFWSGPISTEFPIPITMVLVHDIENLCTEFGKIDPCDPHSADALTVAAANGSMLQIVSIGAGEGERTVGGESLFSAAMVSFISGQGGEPFADSGVSGTVKFDSFEEGDSTDGSYDVVMKSGSKIKGTFDADYCAGIDSFIKKSAGNDATYLGSTGATNCTEQSTRCGKTDKASCTRADMNSNWTCTCTAADGTSTTCTMDKSQQACSTASSVSCCHVG